MCRKTSVGGSPGCVHTGSRPPLTSISVLFVLFTGTLIPCLIGVSPGDPVMMDFATGSVLVPGVGLSTGGAAGQEQALGCCITAYGTGTASVADGKTGLMVGWLLDLIDERDGVVRSGDLGFAVGVGDQDVGAQPQRAGPLTGVPRAERQGRAEVEPVDRGAGSPQCIQYASVGLGLGLVLLRKRIQHQRSALGGQEARGTADYAKPRSGHRVEQPGDDGVEIRPVGRMSGQGHHDRVRSLDGLGAERRIIDRPGPQLQTRMRGGLSNAA